MPAVGQRLAVGAGSTITLENFSPYWMMLTNAPNPPSGSVQGVLIKPWTHTTHMLADCKGWAYITPVNESGAVSVNLPFFEENPYVAATVTNVPGPVPGSESSYLTHAHVTNTLAISSGAVVDVGTISGPVALANGATVALASGAVVDVGTISGPVELAAGTSIEISGNPTVDVSGQSIQIEASNTDIAVEGTNGNVPEPTGTNLTAVALGYYVQQPAADGGQYEFNPLAIVSPNNQPTTYMTYLPVSVTGGSINIINEPSVSITNEPSVRTTPNLTRSAGVDVTVVGAGATVDLSLSPTTIYRLSLFSSTSNANGTVRLQNTNGAWIATCGTNGSMYMDWSNSGWYNGGATLQIYNGGTGAITAGITIEFG